MIFRKLFGGKRLKSPLDLSGLVTDFHSHLIPGIDDGVSDLETSIELIRVFKELGYKKLVTTPHIMADLYKNTPEIILEGIQKVREEVFVQGIDIQIEAAAEYLLDDGFMNKLKNDELLTFGNNYLLIELPHFSIPPNLFEITFELQIRGIKIILAHPERYHFWHHDLAKYEEMKSRGIYFQLNMTSLADHYGSEARKMAYKLIDLGMIDFLGSDMHNFTYLKLFQSAMYEPQLKKLLDSGNLKNHLI